MQKKFEASEYLVIKGGKCFGSQQDITNGFAFVIAPTAYPPVLLTTIDRHEWEKAFAAEDNRITVSSLRENYSQVSERICQGQVRLSKRAHRALADYHLAVARINHVADLFSQWGEYEVFELEQGQTVLVPRLSEWAAAKLARFMDLLSPRTVNRLAGLKRKSKSRTRTPDLISEATSLYARIHPRLRDASKDYTRHKQSSRWPKYVADADRDRPGRPKLPKELIRQLPEKSARELALEWVAGELNQRHADLGATPNTVRGLLASINQSGSESGNLKRPTLRTVSETRSRPLDL